MSDFKGYLAVVCQGKKLSRREAREAMGLLMTAAATEAQTAAFLGALAGRGVLAEELLGFAESLREHALKVRPERGPLVDTCGTGGDGLGTFNISTAAAFAAAGAGAAVAKHGNRAVSSRAGSADVLEALGIEADSGPEVVTRSIEEAGFGFFYAPRYHPAMRHVAPVRKALGVRTVFNLLGPLANPALVRRQVVGVFDPALLELYAEVLLGLGAERALVVRGDDGMDELSLCAPSRVVHLEERRGLWTETVEPEDLGLKRAAPEALRGGDAAENARLMTEIFEGRGGPLLDAVLLNAGAALLAAGLASGLREGVEQARKAVASGKAGEALQKTRRLHGRKA